MRVLVTGSTGFVGRWLTSELRDHGHEVVETGGRAALDIVDSMAVRRLVDEHRPEAIAHLAGVAFGPDARLDPERALMVNAGGTRNVVDAAAVDRIPVLVVSSSEVYGDPDPDALPLSEDAPLRAVHPYGRSKVAAETAALEAAAAPFVPLVIARPFNHTGPGQRLDFVVPAIAARIHRAQEQGSRSIVAGNVDARRDIGDVRDVVRAYRLLLEWLAGRSAASPEPVIVNIATGRSVAIREIIDRLAALAGVEIAIEVDPDLVRPDDPPDLRGDALRLAGLTGWRPAWTLDATLASVDSDVRKRLAAAQRG